MSDLRSIPVAQECQSLGAGVILPCLARAVVLAREGETVIYLVPSAEAARDSWRAVLALGEDITIESLQFGILAVGTGCIQIIQGSNADLFECVRGRVGLIVLHDGLRFHDWRSAARALNGHNFGTMRAQRADGHVPVPRWSTDSRPTFTSEAKREDVA